MRLYKITDDYINYLRLHEPKVLENKNEARPYIGVVLEVNKTNYFVPLSSPKPKHKNMSNDKDFYKIDGGTYGALNFNLMIPAPTQAIVRFNIMEEQDVKYKMLLFNQQSVLSKMEGIIKERAIKLRELYNKDDENLTPHDRVIKERCCDFNMLEDLCKTY